MTTKERQSYPVTMKCVIVFDDLDPECVQEVYVSAAPLKAGKKRSRNFHITQVHFSRHALRMLERATQRVYDEDNFAYVTRKARGTDPDRLPPVVHKQGKAIDVG